MRKRVPVIGSAAAAVTLVLVSTPAWAGTATRMNYSPCNFAGSGAKLTVYADVVAVDRGTVTEIRPGTRARVLSSSCDGRYPVPRELKLKMTVTASGWGISCNPSWPGWGSCTGSASSRSFSDDESGSTATLSRSVSSSESLYFTDGSLGDTTKVCVTAAGGVNGQYVTATACTNV